MQRDCGEGGMERSCHLQIMNDGGIEFQYMYKFNS